MVNLYTEEPVEDIKAPVADLCLILGRNLRTCPEQYVELWKCGKEECDHLEDSTKCWVSYVNSQWMGQDAD